MPKEKKAVEEETKKAVEAVAVEPDPVVEQAPVAEGKYTMLLNVEHNQVSYSKNKTYILDAELAQLFISKGWTK